MRLKARLEKLENLRDGISRSEIIKRVRLRVAEELDKTRREKQAQQKRMDN